MRFPNVTPQAEIDAQLRRAKPRIAAAPSLPWMQAVSGLLMLLALHGFF